jgi:hypothetical protein
MNGTGVALVAYYRQPSKDEGTMRARVLFAGLMALSIVVIAGPASAKVDITQGNIIGPGLEGGLTIKTPDTAGLWESGIDVAGGLDDARADSVERLGLTPADLGPRFRVTYRFGPGRGSGNDLIRQNLYPYAKSGPVTYTPPGQEVKVGINVSITAGWYQSSLGFFHYLVDHGLPDTRPVASASSREPPAVDAARGGQTAPWAGIVLVLMGLATLSLAAPAVRRRVLAGGRLNG